MPVFVPVLLGSSRIGRRSGHVANFIFNALRERQGAATELFDLAEYEFPLMVQRFEDMLEPPVLLAKLRQGLRGADGLIIVAPEYKNGYPGVLKNALDYFEAGILNRKPVGIATVSSGGFGGLNCLAQLRLVCLAMGGLPIPAAFPVSRVKEKSNETGRLVDESLAPKLGKFLDELIWFTEALANHAQTRSTA